MRPGTANLAKSVDINRPLEADADAARIVPGFSQRSRLGHWQFQPRCRQLGTPTLVNRHVAAAALDLEHDRITTLERRLSKQRLHVPAAYRMLERRIHAARNPG
jgi:hypothetical protein